MILYLVLSLDLGNAIVTKNIDNPTHAITTGAATNIIIKLAKLPSGDAASFYDCSSGASTLIIGISNCC